MNPKNIGKLFGIDVIILMYLPHNQIWISPKEVKLFEHLMKLESNMRDMKTVQEQLAEYDLSRLKVEATQILTGLGFIDEWLTKPVSHLSVGWKMRLVLAKMLLQKADFYLFDEPTNA